VVTTAHGATAPDAAVVPGAAAPALTADVAGIPVEDADGPLVEAAVEPPPLEQALRAAQSPRMARLFRMLASINTAASRREVVDLCLHAEEHATEVDAVQAITFGSGNLVKALHSVADARRC
jgi:hypothetical protein